MKLLFVSNTTNSESIATDSGWIFARLLLSELSRMNVECIFLGPIDIAIPGVEWVYMPMTRNKFAARFHVPVSEISAAVKEKEPTHILLNQVEHSPAVRAAMVSLGANPTLLGYCHYVPAWLEGERLVADESLALPGAPEATTLAFCSGVHSCDVVFVHSSYAISVLSSLMEKHGVPSRGNVRLLPPPADPMLTYPDQLNTKNPDGYRVIYNHRLYRQFGTENLIDITRRLTGTKVADVVVTDILGDRNADRVRLDPYPEEARERLRLHGASVTRQGSTREGYRALLAEADAAIAPMRPGCPWSMSVIDCFGLGVPVVGWDVGWFSESLLPALKASSTADLVSRVERLRTDSGLRKSAIEWGHRFVRDLTPEKIARRFLLESESA